MEKFKSFLYTIFLFALIAFSVAFISFHADAKPLQGDSLSGATTRENFLKQGNAEIIVAGVSNYVNAGAAPTTCAGGVPSGGLTVTREKSKAMSGDFYWKIVKSAGDQQGEGIAFDFTVDGFTSTEQAQQELYAKVKVIAGSFLFGTKDVSSDIGFYLYDVTASKTVTLGGGNDILGSEVLRRFMPNKDSTQYRLCAHVQTTATNAFTLGLDDLFAGKAAPIPVGDVNNTFTAKVSSEGVIDDQTGPHRDWLTSCAPQSGTNFICTYRAGLFSSAPSCLVTANSVSGSMPGRTRVYSQSASGVNVESTNSAGVKIGFNVSCTRTGSDYIKGAELADQYSGRDIIFAASKVAGTVNQNTVTPFSSIAKDTAGIGNLNGNMTIPADGDYEIFMQSSSVIDSTIYVWKNGVNNFNVIGRFPNANTVNSYTYKLLDLKKGDVITVRPNGNTDFTIHQITLTRINASQGTQAFRPQPSSCKDSVSEEECATGGHDFTVTPPKPIYKRCHKVVSDVTASGTLATWPTGLTPVGDFTYATTSNRFVKLLSQSTDGSSSTQILYGSDTGLLQVGFVGTIYNLKSGQSVCMEYTR